MPISIIHKEKTFILTVLFPPLLSYLLSRSLLTHLSSLLSLPLSHLDELPWWKTASPPTPSSKEHRHYTVTIFLDDRASRLQRSLDSSRRWTPSETAPPTRPARRRPSCKPPGKLCFLFRWSNCSSWCTDLVDSDLLGREIRFTFDSEPESSVAGVGDQDDQIGRLLRNNPQFSCDLYFRMIWISMILKFQPQMWFEFGIIWFLTKDVCLNSFGLNSMSSLVLLIYYPQ